MLPSQLTSTEREPRLLTRKTTNIPCPKAYKLLSWKDMTHPEPFPLSLLECLSGEVNGASHVRGCRANAVCWKCMAQCGLQFLMRCSSLPELTYLQFTSSLCAVFPAPTEAEVKLVGH